MVKTAQIYLDATKKSLSTHLLVSAFSLALIASLAIGSRSALAAGSLVADVSLTPAGDFKAKSDDVRGEAILDGNKVSAENIKVGLKDVKTGLSLRDRHTKNYLQIDKFPDAILVRASGQDGKGEGLLNLRGIEKQIKGTYTIDGNTLKADFPIKLSDYGIQDIKYMGVGVDDLVTIHVTVPLKKK